MNLGYFAPEIILAGTAIAVILLDLFIERKGLLAAVSLTGIVLALVSIFIMPVTPAQAIFNNILAVDAFAFFFKLLFLGIVALVILFSTDYVSRFERFRGEYYALLLLSALGMMLMAASRELITIYISLELASISLYVLAGFLKDKKSTEASLKYLLLGAMSSAILLYGMALVFGATGETQLDKIAFAVQRMSLSTISDNPALVLGVVLLIAGFGFKIAAFPFQMWVPDVYEGAPTPVVAYLSVGSKAAGFAVILRVFYTAFGTSDWLSANWGAIFAILAAIGMFLGNLTALPQTNIKRMLGYSSIAQAGYLMIGLAALGAAPFAPVLSESGIIFFLTGYALANLGAFAAIIAISNKTGSDLIDDFSGMIKRAPVLTLALSLSLISLIGMPPAAGFIAKFYIFSGAVHSGLLWLVVLAVINSVISAYYYLRVVKVMWFGEPASEEKVPSSGALRLALFLSSLGVLLLGIVPGPVIDLARTAARMLGF
ncbi:MAG TPA: NADH-quinone oxidoreductase subunit N [Dehalococcoidales bacterium]|nr:NADH-quinone oxidoreductase subunit N [Dehalococcoidales bacterium]